MSPQVVQNLVQERAYKNGQLLHPQHTYAICATCSLRQYAAWRHIWDLFYVIRVHVILIFQDSPNTYLVGPSEFQFCISNIVSQTFRHGQSYNLHNLSTLRIFSLNFHFATETLS